jgi:L-fuconolactonase
MIDAHFHLWDPQQREHAWLEEYPDIDRPFQVSDYLSVAAPEGVTGSVLVQVLNDRDETLDFLAVAGSQAVVKGVVGWVDLTSDDVGGAIDVLRSSPGGDKLVGIRHLVQDEPDPCFIERPDVLRGLRDVGRAGLAYDVLVRPPQLPAAVRALRALDDLTVVLDHGGKPPISSGALEPWSTLIGELGQLDNCFCKLSGLVTEAGANWDAQQISPYASSLIEAFGPKRLLFASDWPFCTVAASYHEVVALARSFASSLSTEEQAEMFGLTAQRAYKLPVD